MQDFLLMVLINKKFYFIYYFLLGDLPLKNHLKYIHENALINFEKINPNTGIFFFLIN